MIKQVHKFTLLGCLMELRSVNATDRIFSGGVVMEAQGYPDAPNNEKFPDISLRPGAVYSHKDFYKSSITTKY